MTMTIFILMLVCDAFRVTGDTLFEERSAPPNLTFHAIVLVHHLDENSIGLNAAEVLDPCQGAMMERFLSLVSSAMREIYLTLWNIMLGWNHKGSNP